jgi:hypothetical protein
MAAEVVADAAATGRAAATAVIVETAVTGAAMEAAVVAVAVLAVAGNLVTNHFQALDAPFTR